MTEKYRKIINNPHHVSKKHPQMSIYMRSAQFAPYAALTGYDDVVKEKARLTDRRVEPDEYEISEINRKLCEIAEEEERCIYSVTYFLPDKIKSGGSYVTETDRIKEIDPIEEKIVTDSGVSIPMKEIISIEEVLNEY